MTAPATALPRTMVAVAALIDQVALRLDEAGVRPEQLLSLEVSPDCWEDSSGSRVTVQLNDDCLDAFAALLAVFPNHTRDDYLTGDTAWRKAVSSLRDGTTVQIIAPAGCVVPTSEATS